MNNLTQMFNYNNKQIRIVVIQNEPWFVAKDVCEVLGLSNPSEAMSRLDEDEKSTLRISEGGPEVNIVNEPGLYSLILRSNKPEAKIFKRWVTHEVLPAIRKHGIYATDNVIEKVLDDPDFGIKLLTQLKEERQKRQEFEKVIEKQKPLVEFAEHVSTSKNAILVRELAKVASKHGVLIGERRLYAKLRSWGLIFHNSTEPKQEYIDRGYFEVSEGVVETSKGSFTHRTTRITGKGQIYIINRLKDEMESKKSG